MMENQNEREEWNDRWLMQIVLWELEVKKLLHQVDALMAMIDLAESQIKQDPPE